LEWPKGTPGPSNVEIVDYHQEKHHGTYRYSPGRTSGRRLKALGMSAAELVRQLDVPTNRVTEYPERKACHRW